MARKNVGLRYGEFEFPAEQGFTGSAGQQTVKGYQRGGKVKSPDKTKGKGKSTAGMPKNVKAKGGKVGYQEGGEVRPGHAEGPNPFNPATQPAQYRLWERKHHRDPAPPPPPPPEPEGGGILGGLGRLFGRSERELEEIGEKHGGYIDKTKGKGKSKKGFPSTVKKEGGKVKAGEGGYYGKPGDKYPKSKARQKMPKGVKARGGKVGYAEGGMVDDSGYVDKMRDAGAKMGFAYGGRVQVSDTSGEFKQRRSKMDSMDHGVQPARRGGNARNQQQKEAGGTGRLKPGLKKGGRVAAKAAAESKHVAKATKVAKPTRAAKGGYAAGDKKTHPTSRGRTPYKGYNKQPGGSGNKDSRYMKGSTRGK